MSTRTNAYRRSFSAFFASFLALLALVGCGPGSVNDADPDATSAPPVLTVFATASTTNVIQNLAAQYETNTGVRITPSFAASSTLARQIAAGAPADLFLSANPEWMDYLKSNGHLLDGSRRDLIGNRVVLIAPSASPIEALVLDASVGLPALLGANGRLAMGDPAHVPAGLYGQQALKSFDLWAELAPRLAPMSDVRAALTMVERGETPLGIVYATDAAISERVRVIGTFPAATHDPVVYPIALVSGGQQELAQAFLDFPESPEAARVFRQYGFTLD